MSPRDSLHEYFDLDPAIKDVPNAINDALANGPGERLRKVHGGLPSTLRYTVAVSAISFFAIKRLVFPTYVAEDPRPHWATAIPPLARTFIDAIVNVVYLAESPRERVERFIKAGVCKELSRHRRLSALYAGDPSWQGPLAQLKEWIDGTEALAPLSEAERASLDQSTALVAEPRSARIAMLKRRQEVSHVLEGLALRRTFAGLTSFLYGTCAPWADAQRSARWPSPGRVQDADLLRGACALPGSIERGCSRSQTGCRIEAAGTNLEQAHRNK